MLSKSDTFELMKAKREESETDFLLVSKDLSCLRLTFSLIFSLPPD